MNPRRILVTGGNGFVGGFLLPALRAAWPDAEVRATGFDVTDRDAVFAGIAALPPDYCVHLAGVSSIGQATGDPARAWAVNLHGAVTVAEAILAHAPGCGLLFVSTAEVYGASFRSEQALDESAALSPLNLYAATKAAAEMALTALTARGLRLLRLRPFNHTGPGQSEAFVVPAFAGQIARIEAGLMPPVMQVGALEPERDFLDVRDVCTAYVKCIAHFEVLPFNSIVNIASGRPVGIGRLLEMLLAGSQCAIEVVTDAARLRPLEIRRAVGDAKYAGKLLGWAPAHELPETLAAVLTSARAGLAGPQP